MHPLRSTRVLWALLATFATLASAQDDYQRFRAGIEHATTDEKDDELGIVNSYLTFLRELQTQFDEHYGKPAGLQRRA